jgi:hypothetical protein
MKVVRWISGIEANSYISFNNDPFTGLGGFFDHGMRWSDYIKTWKDKDRPFLEAIRESIIEHGYRHTGEHHQYGDNGTPLFENGTVANFSYRGWGDLMAAIWSEVEDKDYNYMDFYM